MLRPSTVIIIIIIIIIISGGVGGGGTQTCTQSAGASAPCDAARAVGSDGGASVAGPE